MSSYQFLRLDPSDPDSARVNIRVQSNGTAVLDPGSFVGNERSRYVSLEHNEVRGGVQPGDYGYWVAPENDASVQAVLDVAIFNNHFTGWTVGNEMGLGAEDVAFGENTFDRIPAIATGFKINSGLASGPYADGDLSDPTPF